MDYEVALGEERLPETVEIGRYRVTQEALTNMRKHSRARWVRIELLREREEVRLMVADDGGGSTRPRRHSKADLESGWAL